MDMNDSPNYAEYAVEKKSEGRLRLCRALLVLGYAAFTIGYFILSLGVTKMAALIAILPLLLYILHLCTWRLVSYDVSYSFEAGTMIFRRVYTKGRRTTKEKLRLRVNDAEYVGLGSDERTAAAMVGVDRVYDFASSSLVPNLVVLVMRDQAGRRIAVRFDGIRRVAKLMHVYCPQSTLDSEKFSF